MVRLVTVRWLHDAERERERLGLEVELLLQLTGRQMEDYQKLLETTLEMKRVGYAPQERQFEAPVDENPLPDEVMEMINALIDPGSPDHRRMVKIAYAHHRGGMKLDELPEIIGEGEPIEI